MAENFWFASRVEVFELDELGLADKVRVSVIIWN